MAGVDAPGHFLGKRTLLATIKPYQRTAKSAIYGMDIESFLLPSKPAEVIQG